MDAAERNGPFAPRTLENCRHMSPNEDIYPCIRGSAPLNSARGWSRNWKLLRIIHSQLSAGRKIAGANRNDVANVCVVRGQPPQCHPSHLPTLDEACQLNGSFPGATVDRCQCSRVGTTIDLLSSRRCASCPGHDHDKVPRTSGTPMLPPLLPANPSHATMFL